HICLTCTVVTTFNGIVEQTENGVTVVLVIFSSVNTTLCRNRVCTAWRILEAESLYIIAQLAKCCSSRSTGQASTYYYNIIFTFVSRVNQLYIEFMLFPFFGQWPFRDFGI